jgi:ribosomal protein S18 acetylase RimI-like enzyme
MNDSLAVPVFRFRDFRFEDIPTLVDIGNRTTPDDPTTVEREEYDERTYPADNPRLRLAVENAAGQFIGLGVCQHPFWIQAPGVYFVWMIIDPAWRRRGIGQALLPTLAVYARKQDAEKLWTGCREDQDYSIRFLERAGFHNYGVRFESILDLTTFDDHPYASEIDRVRQAGFEFTDFAAESAINPEADQLLYDLDEVTRVDVPWPGGARSVMTHEQFRQRFFEHPHADPSAILIAKHQGRFAGFTIVMFEPERPAHTMMTGVRRDYRGQGVALALKVLSLRLMKERGRTQALTNNDTANPSILHLNERLGYQKRSGDLQWEKKF